MSHFQTCVYIYIYKRPDSAIGRAPGRQPGGSGFESQSGGCFRVSLSDRIRRLDADSTSLTIGEAIRAFQTASLSTRGRLSDRIEVDWARGAGKSFRLRRVDMLFLINYLTLIK